MQVMGVIILIGLSVFTLYFISFIFRSKKLVKKAIKNGNIIVFGHKGKGKDLFFQYMVNLENKEYFSNMNYGGKFNDFDLVKDLDLGITYENLIDNNFEIVEKNEKLEGRDIYLSDGGIYFPAQYDSALHRKYKSFPLLYAVQRHLYNSNIHVNTQALTRLWKALREQADSFFKCHGVIKIFGILIVSFTYYSEYRSAENGVLPFPKPLLESKEVKAQRLQFESTNGVIQKGIILLHKKNIKYDTRAFHEKFFGKKFEG